MSLILIIAEAADEKCYCKTWVTPSLFPIDKHRIEALQAELAAKDNIIQVQNKQIEGNKAQIAKLQTEIEVLQSELDNIKAWREGWRKNIQQ